MSPLSANLNGLMRLLVLSVAAPRIAAAILISLGLGRAILWQALLLVTVLSVLLVAITQGPMPDMPVGDHAPIIVTPFSYAVILGSSLVMLVFALHFTGLSLGGTGDFGAALALVIWFWALGMALRIVLVFVGLFSPDAAAAMAMLGLGLMFWILVNFVNVLHDFDHLGKSLLTLVLAIIGISLGIALILAAIGVGVSGGSFDV